jgi:pimeloyl-ACP methyl ester carboxylesterase
MFTLEELTTPKGYIHQGIVAYPSHVKRKALIWVHGLTSTFYGNKVLLNALAKKSVEEGIVCASFNTRGHDMITGVRIADSTQEKGYRHGMGGAGYEVFEECIDDIAGVINFLEEKGIEEVILLGHSTGANKVSYYAATQKDNRIKGVVLGSPLSDRYGPGFDKEKLNDDIQMMKELINSGKGDGLVLGKTFFPLTPKRFLSLVTPGPEDQMGYGEHPPSLPYVSSITVPMFVLLGSKDEYLDRAAEEVLKVFKQVSNSSSYNQELLINAFHSYNGMEDYVADKILSWIINL